MRKLKIFLVVNFLYLTGYSQNFNTQISSYNSNVQTSTNISVFNGYNAPVYADPYYYRNNHLENALSSLITTIIVRNNIKRNKRNRKCRNKFQRRRNNCCNLYSNNNFNGRRNRIQLYEGCQR